MKTRPLGNTGIKVSVLCLGTMYFGTRTDAATSYQLLDQYVEAGGTFARLVEGGKVRFIGAGNFLAWRLERANWVGRTHGWPEYCCIQQRHSYLRPKPGASFAPQLAASEDLLDLCQAQGITLLAYSVLLSGAYTRPERSIRDGYVGPDSDARLAALKAVAEQTGATPNQVVLAWMMGGQPSVLPLIAASTGRQLQENLDALKLELNADQIEHLNSARAT